MNRFDRLHVQKLNPETIGRNDENEKKKIYVSSKISAKWSYLYFVMLLFLGEAPTSICHFFHLSVRPFVAHHIPGTVHHVVIIFGTRVKWWYIYVLFLFFRFFLSFDFFLVVRRIKAQEIAQNEKKKLHPSRAVSQEQCSIWSWFLVHLRKMMKPPGSKRPKIINGPKWPKIMSVTFHISVEAGGRGGFLGHMLKSRRSPFFLLHF